MKTKFLGRFLMAAALLAGPVLAASKDKASLPQTDEQIIHNVRHEVLMYPYYTLWDDVNFRVVNGQVELTGDVTEPVKKSDLGRLIQRVPGVTGVANNLEVLPLSPMDNRLRLQVARAIYGYPALSRYGQGAIPSIHIIVDNGHVTLRGVVLNDMDKQIAGMRASGAGLSFGAVVNQLQVENPSPKKS